MRVAINLLTDDPRHPSGAHWCWTRVVPEMAKLLTEDEELHLLVSPKSRELHQGYGPNVRYIMYPWSNEKRNLRTLSEHLYSPIRLPLSRINVFATLMAPLISPTWSLVIHMKTMHAFTTPDSLSLGARTYRRLNYPRSVRLADAIIVNSESMRREVDHYLDADPEKVHLIYEAVDHDLFRPGNRAEAAERVRSYGLERPFGLFVSTLWRYKNCEGLLRAWALVRQSLGGRQLAIVGYGEQDYVSRLKALTTQLGLDGDVVFVGGVSQQVIARFHQAADVLVYPSFNETFGLPILEAMACGTPVVTSNMSSMPEIAGDAAILVDPGEPGSIADAIVRACGPESDNLRQRGLRRAAQFTWKSTAEATLAVYRRIAQVRR